MKFLKQLKGIINKTEWKIYFFIFILGHIIAYDIVGAFNLNSIKSVISFIVLILSAIGFFGIAWRKKIFTQYLVPRKNIKKKMHRVMNIDEIPDLTM